VALDPFYAQAHAYLAWWHNLHTGRLNNPATEDAQKASRFAATALELDPNDAFCIAVAAHIEGFLRKNLETAADMFDRALSLNENSAFAWGVSGATYCFLGRPDESLERLRNAWRLSPFDPMNFFFCTVSGLAEIISGRYDQAVGWLRKSEHLNPRFAAGLRTLVAFSGKVIDEGDEFAASSRA
jgi:tetratricopeptide (TPR) repeat protein